MRSRLGALLCWSTLCFALALANANASESHIFYFAISCDGTQKTQNFQITGLAASTNRFIQGAEISTFEDANALQYAIVESVGTASNNTLVTLGQAHSHASNQFTGFYSVTTSASGILNFRVSGVCSTPAPFVQGFVTISLFS
jgi:hypothetical protein